MFYQCRTEWIAPTMRDLAPEAGIFFLLSKCLQVLEEKVIPIQFTSILRLSLERSIMLKASADLQASQPLTLILQEPNSRSLTGSKDLCFRPGFSMFYQRRTKRIAPTTRDLAPDAGIFFAPFKVPFKFFADCKKKFCRSDSPQVKVKSRRVQLWVWGASSELQIQA